MCRGAGTLPGTDVLQRLTSFSRTEYQNHLRIFQSVDCDDHMYQVSCSHLELVLNINLENVSRHVLAGMPLGGTAKWGKGETTLLGAFP